MMPSQPGLYTERLVRPARQVEIPVTTPDHYIFGVSYLLERYPDQISDTDLLAHR